MPLSDAGSGGYDEASSAGATDADAGTESPTSTEPSPTRGPDPRAGDGGESDDAPTWLVYTYDLVSVFVAVALVGTFVFAVSGVWPPMVAIESGSMNPNVQPGDLVFVMDEHRFAGEDAQQSTGVVTRQSTDSYEKFGKRGDVIVYTKDGRNGTTPIIHRAMFWVENDERWFDEANPQYVGNADSCEELKNCPAPHAGFITKGDNNRTNTRYDQVMGLSGPVKPAWIVGTAETRIPLAGCLRLFNAPRKPPVCNQILP